MQQCDFCEREIGDHSAICPYCGKLQMSAGERRKQNQRIVLVAGLTILIFAAAALYAYLRHGVVPHFG